MGIFASSLSGLSPGGIVTVSAGEFFKNCFADCYTLIDLVDTSPVGFWSCFGGSSLVGVLKVASLDVRSEPFVPQREAGSQGFPSDCMVLC